MRPAIFIHPQKTAGTSLVLMARGHYGIADTASHGDFAVGDITRKRLISGHFGFSFAEPLLPGRFSFTFLRDPVDRVISLYNFCRTRPPEQFPIYAAANRWNFEDFVVQTSIRPERGAALDDIIVYETVWNNLTWQLAYGWGGNVMDTSRSTVLDFSDEDLISRAKANMLRLDFVGMTETFEDDSRRILAELQIPQPKVIARDNVSPSGVKRSELSNSVMNHIRGATDLDQRIYDFACELRA